MAGSLAGEAPSRQMPDKTVKADGHVTGDHTEEVKPPHRSSSPEASPGSSAGRRGRSRTRGTGGSHSQVDLNVEGNTERQCGNFMISIVVPDVHETSQGVPLINVLVRKSIPCREKMEAHSRDGKWCLRICDVSISVLYVGVI